LNFEIRKSILHHIH